VINCLISAGRTL